MQSVNTTQNRVSGVRKVAECPMHLCVLDTVRRKVLRSQTVVCFASVTLFKKNKRKSRISLTLSLSLHKRDMRETRTGRTTGLRNTCCCRNGRCEPTEVPWCLKDVFVCMWVCTGCDDAESTLVYNRCCACGLVRWMRCPRYQIYQVSHNLQLVFL